MTSASQAPANKSGSGSVVQSPARQTTRRVQKTKKTNLLSIMSPEERRPFLQEMLDQSAIFRQIASAKNGVPGVIHRNIIGEPTEEEYQEASTDTGVPIAEVRRREELARREAMIELREEVLRRTEETIKKQEEELRRPSTQPDEEEPVVLEEADEPGLTEEEVLQREDLARREQQLEGHEQNLRDRQERADAAKVQREQEEAAAAAERQRRAEERTAEQAAEAERRALADEARREELTAEEARRREEEDRREEEADRQREADNEAAREREAARVREHEERMANLENDREELRKQREQLAKDREEARRAAEEAAEQEPEQPTPPVVPVPVPDPIVDDGAPVTPPVATVPDIDPNATVPVNVPFYKRNGTLIGGGLVLAGLAIAAALVFGDRFKPTPVVDPPAEVTTDTETLHILQSHGLAAPQTPLGEKILEAFKEDPALREEVMKRVEETLIKAGKTDPPGNGGAGP